MTCGDKFNKNCPTGGTRVDPAEADGRPRCIHAGCAAPLQGDNTCTRGHSQDYGESAREMLVEAEQLLARQDPEADHAALLALALQARRLVERSQEYAGRPEAAPLAAQLATTLQRVYAEFPVSPGSGFECPHCRQQLRHGYVCPQHGPLRRVFVPASGTEDLDLAAISPPLPPALPSQAPTPVQRREFRRQVKTGRQRLQQLRALALLAPDGDYTSVRAIAADGQRNHLLTALRQEVAATLAAHPSGSPLAQEVAAWGEEMEQALQAVFRAEIEAAQQRVTESLAIAAQRFDPRNARATITSALAALSAAGSDVIGIQARQRYIYKRDPVDVQAACAPLWAQLIQRQTEMETQEAQETITALTAEVRDFLQDPPRGSSRDRLEDMVAVAAKRNIAATWALRIKDYPAQVALTQLDQELAARWEQTPRDANTGTLLRGEANRQWVEADNAGADFQTGLLAYARAEAAMRLAIQAGNTVLRQELSQLYTQMGYFAGRRNNHRTTADEVEYRFQQAQRVAEEAGDLYGQAWALHGQAWWFSTYYDDPAKAIVLLEQSHALLTQTGNAAQTKIVAQALREARTRAKRQARGAA